MSYGWIDPDSFTINALLLMDHWILRQIAINKDPVFNGHLGRTLASHPAVLWYFTERCPERADHFKSLAADGDRGGSDVRVSERFVLDELDWAVVYLYPDLMEQLDYIRLWDPQRLLSLTDFNGKTVLDIGSGTGRLAFAAAPPAREGFAAEPVDRLREHLRRKRDRLNLPHVRVLDGCIEELPFSDDSFDIVMSGHVLGDDFDREYAAMERVTRDGGIIIDCPGEDHRKRPGGIAPEMIRLGFQWSTYVSVLGGDVHRCWKTVRKGPRRPEGAEP
jgi:SAM-dependent methyltransferase